MSLSKVNEDIARHYAKTLTLPIKYGENGVFFWFPGSGMTTVVRDIFSSKNILLDSLASLSERLQILQFWGHLTPEQTCSDLLQIAGFSTLSSLKRYTEKELEKGNELVYVLGRIDNYSETEKVAIFNTFLQLNALNSRRVHIIFNSTDKAGFETLLKMYPQFLALANTIEAIPILAGELLDNYIDQKGKEYGRNLTPVDKEDIVKNFGGILQLTKESLRSNGNIHSIQLKFGIIWNNLNSIYREIIVSHLAKKNTLSSSELNDLKSFGVFDLNVFDLFRLSLSVNTDEMLQSLLTTEESALYTHLTNNSGKVVDKEKVLQILRPKDTLSVSFWAADQAVSRFRKKLARAGIDPERLQTLKGKGYKWI